MDFGTAIRSGFKNAFKFTGRASRSEFWWFYLFYVLCLFGGGMLAGIAGAAIASAGNDESGIPVIAFLGVFGLVIIAFFFPMLSLIFRRLHDSDKSAWFILLYLVPFGGIVLFIFYCLPGTQGPNPFGEDPLNPTARIAKTFA